MCPVCLAVIAETESDVLNHLLVGHPVALTILGALLAIANVALARRPRDLLLFDAGVAALAVAIAQGQAGRQR